MTAGPVDWIEDVPDAFGSPPAIEEGESPLPPYPGDDEQEAEFGPEEPPEPIALPRPGLWRPWQTWDAANGSPGPLHGPRRDRPDGSKVIPWPAGAKPAALIYFATKDHRPPEPGAALIVTEGEKVADAVADAGYAAAGTVCGAPSTPDSAVVGLLARYQITLAPDNDDVGQRHMARLAAALEKAGSDSCRWIKPAPDAPAGWDLADVDPGRRRELIEGARDLLGFGLIEPAAEPSEATWPEPEDRGAAVLSELGETEYVEDLIRPGRIVVWAAEEGSGKSYTVDDELAIRVAVAGGSFAETWPVLQTGPVLVLSEMHADDDYGRETTVLASLGQERSALSGRYFRLSLMTAAGGKPALTVPEWRDWITGWLRDREALLLVVDTATGASQVDPWGGAIQAVYQSLRAMLAAYPALAVVLVVHLKKPQGHGERRLSDVLGEWGRWNDVTVLMENDGASLDRCKITVRKRVRHERRIIATKRGGLLVEVADADTTKGTKVPLADVVAYVTEHPGSSYADIGKALEVTKDTASNYVKAAGLPTRTVGPRRQTLVYPPETTAEPPNTTEQAQFGGHSAVEATERETTAEPPNEPYRGSVVGSSVVPPGTVRCRDYRSHQSSHRRVGNAWTCDACSPGGAV